MSFVQALQTYNIGVSSHLTFHKDDYIELIQDASPRGASGAEALCQGVLISTKASGWFPRHLTRPVVDPAIVAKLAAASSTAKSTAALSAGTRHLVCLFFVFSLF